MPFIPSNAGRSQARYDYLTGNQQQNYSGGGGGSGGNAYPSAQGGYRYRSPSPSRNGGAQRGSSFRRTSSFDKHSKQRREVSVKFDWSAALVLGSSSEQLFHRVRVSLSGSDGKVGETAGEASPSWSSVVGQQVSWHGVGDHDVSFSFIDDEQVRLSCYLLGAWCLLPATFQ
jgi:hypothetical protein